jgi:4-amino-4-deoxy-L-arabinose transferase-like glycosyltransferase
MACGTTRRDRPLQTLVRSDFLVLGLSVRVILRLLAFFLLVAMLLMMLGSSHEDAFTSDEPAHITAGYSYLRFQDGRLNPEHPPLIKMLAAVPLLTLQLQFPLSSPDWRDALNGQWDVAKLFLYESGNDPHLIAARARLTLIFLTVAFGAVLFIWTQRFAGALAGILALFFYVFSPSLLAHGRLVTTDVAAAAGITVAGFVLIRFLHQPSSRAAVAAGFGLGAALLCKFSTILLVPLFALMVLLWMFLKPASRSRYLSGSGIMTLAAAVVVLVPYLWITARYPPEKQLWDTYFTFFHMADGPAALVGNATAETDFAQLRRDRTRDLRACVSGGLERQTSPLRRCPLELVIFLADKPVLRAWAQYLLGLISVIRRTEAGGTYEYPFYFLGAVSLSGWPHYFPVVYAIREPLALHITTALALFLAMRRLWSSPWDLSSRISWLRSHPAETVMLSWLGLYWATAITANLNLGIRHLLPVFPFTIVLVAREVSRWLNSPIAASHQRPVQYAKCTLIAAMLLWQSASVLHVYPSFMAYFNEIAGGAEGGADYVLDFDWGQDLIRLRNFVAAHHIEKIALDYFGTSSPSYELGKKFVPWRSADGPPPGWLAVSAIRLKIAQGQWPPDLGHPAEDAYEWLRGKKPVAKIGYSIFVFNMQNDSGRDIAGTDSPRQSPSRDE